MSVSACETQRKVENFTAYLWTERKPKETGKTIGRESQVGRTDNNFCPWLRLQ